MIPQTEISILVIKKHGSCRLWDLDSNVEKVMCKLQCILGVVEFKLIKLLRQWNLREKWFVTE